MHSIYIYIYVCVEWNNEQSKGNLVNDTMHACISAFESNMTLCIKAKEFA